MNKKRDRKRVVIVGLILVGILLLFSWLYLMTNAPSVGKAIAAGEKVQLGEACQQQDDCATGLECRDLLCLRPLVSEGGACRQTADCVAGLECRTAICSRPLIPEGGACRVNNECQEGLGCYGTICQRYTCTDSDDGANPTEEGTVTVDYSISEGYDRQASDGCFRGGQTVGEYICHPLRGASLVEVPCPQYTLCRQGESRCRLSVSGEQCAVNENCQTGLSCLFGVCQEMSCTDSDDGFNPVAERGTVQLDYSVSEQDDVQNDECINNGRIREYDCVGGMLHPVETPCSPFTTCRLNEGLCRLSAVQEACGVDENCVAGLECRNAVCSRPLIPEGGACALDDECQEGLVCANVICQRYTCIDSDEGANIPTEQGTVTVDYSISDGYDHQVSDGCLRGGQTVGEYICHPRGGVDLVRVPCPQYTFCRLGESRCRLGVSGEQCEVNENCQEGLVCGWNICQRYTCTDSDGGANILTEEGTVTVDYSISDAEDYQVSDGCLRGGPTVGEYICHPRRGASLVEVPCPQYTFCRRGEHLCRLSAAGEQCEVNENCQSSLICRRNAVGQELLCSARAAVNAFCEGHGHCQSGRCQINSRNPQRNKCIAAGAVNQACRSNNPGDWSSGVTGVCDGRLVCSNDRCRQAGGINQLCYADGTCSVGLTCINNQCRQPGVANQPCRPEGDPAGRCNANLACVSNVCRSAGGNGQYCRPAAPRCNSPLACVNDRCRQVGGANQPCKADGTCNTVNLVCRQPENTCRAAGGNGQYCRPSASQCNSGFTCVGERCVTV